MAIHLLIHGAFSISDEKTSTNRTQLFETNLTAECSGCNKKKVDRTISKHRSGANNLDTQSQEELNKRSLSIFPYVKGTTDRIDILNKHNIQTIFKPPRKLEQILRNPKDA